MTESQPLSLDFSLLHDSEGEGISDATQLGSLARFVLEAEGATGHWAIAVALMNEEHLRSLHAQFMGIDEPTDIMTFPYDDDILGGDLAISAEHALARAEEWGNSPVQEVQFLVAHGVLHLVGWQDTSAEQRTAMLERQEELVRGWRSGNP